jgi:uncharacterized damage-inducible protein DinB
MMPREIESPVSFKSPINPNPSEGEITMAISASMLPELEMELVTTRKCLERLPEDKFSWKPHEKSMPLVGLATHIVNMLGWGTHTCKHDSFDVAPVGGAPYREEPAASTADLLAQFDMKAAEFKAALAATTDEQMMATWTLLSGGNAMFAMPRVACIRGMIMNHIVHHRGQLTVYMRLNDIAVPSIYGPSADEQS